MESVDEDAAISAAELATPSSSAQPTDKSGLNDPTGGETVDNRSPSDLPVQLTTTSSAVGNGGRSSMDEDEEQGDTAGGGDGGDDSDEADDSDDEEASSQEDSESDSATAVANPELDTGVTDSEDRTANVTTDTDGETATAVALVKAKDVAVDQNPRDSEAPSAYAVTADAAVSDTGPEADIMSVVAAESESAANSVATSAKSDISSTSLAAMPGDVVCLSGVDTTPELPPAQTPVTSVKSCAAVYEGGTSSDQYCLRWNDIHSNVKTSLAGMRSIDDPLLDVSFVAQGRVVKAHKLVLSSCSPFLRDVLRQPDYAVCVPGFEAHPVILLPGATFDDISSILNFMYQGEVNVSQENLSTFLALAEDLRVRGLSEKVEKSVCGMYEHGAGAHADAADKGGGAAMLTSPSSSALGTPQSQNHHHHQQPHTGSRGGHAPPSAMGRGSMQHQQHGKFSGTSSGGGGTIDANSYQQLMADESLSHSMLNAGASTSSGSAATSGYAINGGASHQMHHHHQSTNSGHTAPGQQQPHQSATSQHHHASQQSSSSTGGQSEPRTPKSANARRNRQAALEFWGSAAASGMSEIVQESIPRPYSLHPLGGRDAADPLSQIMVAHSTKGWHCPQCLHISTTKGNLKSHILSGRHKLFGKSFACQYCQKTYSTRQSLQVHISTNHRYERDMEYKDLNNAATVAAATASSENVNDAASGPGELEGAALPLHHDLLGDGKTPLARVAYNFDQRRQQQQHCLEAGVATSADDDDDVDSKINLDLQSALLNVDMSSAMKGNRSAAAAAAASIFPSQVMSQMKQRGGGGVSAATDDQRTFPSAHSAQAVTSSATALSSHHLTLKSLVGSHAALDAAAAAAVAHEDSSRKRKLASLFQLESQQGLNYVSTAAMQQQQQQDDASGGTSALSQSLQSYSSPFTMASLAMKDFVANASSASSAESSQQSLHQQQQRAQASNMSVQHAQSSAASTVGSGGGVLSFIQQQQQQPSRAVSATAAANNYTSSSSAAAAAAAAAAGQTTFDQHQHQQYIQQQTSGHLAAAHQQQQQQLSLDQLSSLSNEAAAMATFKNNQHAAAVVSASSLLPAAALSGSAQYAASNAAVAALSPYLLGGAAAAAGSGGGGGASHTSSSHTTNAM